MADQSNAYKSTYQLVQMLFSLSDNVPKKWRRVLWEKTIDTATDLLPLIIYAYETQNLRERVAYLDKALTKFTVLNTYIRLCNENVIIPTQKATNIAELTTDISKQLGGWRRATAAAIEKSKSV